jgi:SAM-dependent methyltransferase
MILKKFLPEISTFRRFYLDAALESHREIIHGDVLDIGGKRKNKRGKFRLESNTIRSVKYVNIDPNAKPDLLEDASQLPIISGLFDTVLLCEVLEHVHLPERVIEESVRMLKPNGHLLLSMPFLYGSHADPYDFQRWTAKKHSDVLQQNNLKTEVIKPMGGIYSVFFDLIFLATGTNTGKSTWEKRTFRRMLSVTKGIFHLSEKFLPNKESAITGGYFVIGKKRSNPN